MTLELEEREQAPPPPEEPPRPRVSTAVVVTLVGAILAAGISGVNLVYELWPSLRPDPKESVGATIESLALDRNVSRADYLARTGTAVPAGTDGAANGNVFYVRASIQGFKRSEVRLRWFTYNADNQVRLPGLRSNDRETPVFEPQAPLDAQIAQVWVPNPGRGGTFFVRFELWAGTVLLAFVDTESFELIRI